MTDERKVVISPGFGAGFATWNSQHDQYALAECPGLIAYVEAGGHDEEVAMAILVEAGLVKADDYVCFLGAADWEVVEVEPPYRICEYDGFESVEDSSDTRDNWRQ